MCTRKGLVNAGERIVVVQKVHDDLTLKIVSVDELGHGIKKIRHQSLQDLVAAAGCVDCFCLVLFPQQNEQGCRFACTAAEFQCDQRRARASGGGF